MSDFTINSKPVAHMAAQIRAKQLATSDTQSRIQKAIVEWEEQNPDKSGNEVSKQIVEGLEQFYNISNSINDYFKEQKIPATDLGYPIKFNKTNLQLKMAYDYAKEQGENLLGQIEKGNFYNGLSNDINPGELPILQSNNQTSYWGNENSSVSSGLLFSISSILNTKKTSLTGAATLYPFYNTKSELPDKLIVENYPFAYKNGMLLFGDYQFGGHRNLEEQLVFGPEDCSSAVGKATGLTTEQIKTINTTQMRENYSSYSYTLVTTLSNNIDQKQLESIEPGYFYLHKSHTAIIATKPDNYSNITTLQFNRDIDRAEQKLLGGGLYNYNLITKASEDPNSLIYILRAENSKSPREETSSLGFLNKVGTSYRELYPEGPSEDVIGDCSMLIPSAA